MAKAQIISEFLIAIVIVVFVCGTVFIIASQKNNDLEYVKSKQAASALCSNIASSMDEVWSMNLGAAIKVNVPTKLNSLDYTAKITSQKSVVVMFSSNSLICPFVADVTNGTSSNFTIGSGTLTAYNNGSMVVVSVV